MHSVPADSRAQPTINLEPVPYPRVGAYNERWFASTSDYASLEDIIAADNTLGIRATCIDGTVNWAIYSARGALAEIINPALGEVFTIICNIRSSTDLGVQIRVGYGYGVGNGLQQFTADATPEIKTFRYTFAVNGNISNAGNAFFKFYMITDSWTAGDWFEVSKVIVVKGAYAGNFGAGDMPNWQWTGMSNDSTSIGYPTF